MYLLLPLLAAGTYGCKFLFKNCNEEFLNLYIAQATTTIVCFKLVERGVIGEITFKVLGLAERVEVCEDGITFNLSKTTLDKQTGEYENVQITVGKDGDSTYEMVKEALKE